MSKDDFDIFRHLAKDPKANNAVKLIKGLRNREIGALRKNDNKEQLQIFAEEELVRKKELEEMRCQMPGIPRSTFLMVFSPDGQRAASTHSNHNIYVTDLRTGKNIKTLVGHPRTPWCIAFHPTSNQIVASGCLGGQVRVWDLSGGSEVWTTATQSVIASIAFHPSDRILVIATFNEVHFWDWSLAEPFVHVSTNSPKEKVRYVAFDKLGHKLITGVANNPQTRWERVRAPVPVPRQERCASPYRRRITQRLVTSAGNAPNPQPSYPEYPAPQNNTPSVVPERERRITMCYQNLVREYELLVHRYLQLHRAPTMIDRGTDPMEPNHFNSGTQTAGSREHDPSLPGPSGLQSAPNSASMSSDTILEPSVSARTTINTADSSEPQPSTSQSQNLITPSRIFSVCRKPPSSIRGTQTVESRKHKFDGGELNRNNEKRLKRNNCENTSSESDSSREPQPQEQTQVETNFPDVNSSNLREDQRVLVVNLERLRPESEIQSNSSMCVSNAQTPHQSSFTESGTSQGFPPGFIIDDVIPPGQPTAAGSPGNPYSERFNEYIRSNRARIQEFRRRTLASDRGSSSIAPSTSANTDGDVQASTSVNNDNGAATNGAVDELIHNIRRTAEHEVRNRILPIITSIPPPDRPELIRLFENSREHVRLRFRQMFPTFLRRHARRSLRVRIGSSTDSSSSDNEVGRHSPSNANQLNSEATEFPNRIEDPNHSIDTTAPQSTDNATLNSSTSSATLPPRMERNFNTELEQLVTSLLTEIERSDNPSANSRQATSNSTIGDTNNNYSQSTSARTRPTHPHLWPGSGVPISQPPGDSIENIFQRDSVRESESERSSRYGWMQDTPIPLGATSPFGYGSSPSHTDPRGSSFSNSDTRTTSSPMYTTAGLRRRFFSHRVSAFMPTRVNYSRMRCRRNPHYAVGSGRSGIPRTHRSPTIVLDELINYAEREQSEEDASNAAQQPFEQPDDGRNCIEQYPVLRALFSNIVQDLESTLSDVRNINPSIITTPTISILSSFSDRLDNIIANSDTFLRNIRRIFDDLPSEPADSARPTTGSEPRWNFNDPAFYVRDLRTDTPNNMDNGGPTSPNLQEIFGYMHAATTDHTYPRNPNRTGASDVMSPFFNSLHLTISHIHSQASLLRRWVESIERIDRAMVEVGQLQLMRNLVTEMVRHIRSSAGESRSAGISSVRQMMAGTRISDTSPSESPNEDGGNMGNQTRPQPEVENPQPGPSSSNASSTDQPGPSRGPIAGPSTGTSRRSMNRKTYPPSRYVRLARNNPRRSLVNWFARHAPSRGERGSRQSRSGSARPPPVPNSNIGSHNIFNYSTVSPATLSLMTRRLERLLTEQMRVLARLQDPSSPPSRQSNATLDLGEHILSLRLHGCFMRMRRVLGSNMNPSMLRNITSDSRGAAVTQDGAVRYSVRYILSLIVDGMSRYIEEVGNGTISSSMRLQIHGVLAMSVLLAEVVLLQVIDSIPALSSMNSDYERAALASSAAFRRWSNYRHSVPTAYLIARGLKLMRLTMRYANRALDETYTFRRNALMPRHDIDRRLLFGTINSCLRIIKRIQTRNFTHPVSESSTEIPSTPAGSSDNSSERTATDLYSETFYSTIHSLIARYADSREEVVPSQPSGPRERTDSTNDLSSNNDNSDEDPDDPEEPDWFYQRHSHNSNRSNNSRHLYRTNNVNLAPQPPAEQPRPSVRFGNLPSVQVNDVPVSEPSVFAVHRLIAHRRFAERVSELRANPRVGLFRPRFLHPLYASLNPFDADLDDPQRDQIYDNDMIATVTPNHRIQAWDISNGQIPGISNSLKNVVVSECKIHNDASVDIATDGTILVTLLPSGGYLNVTNRLGVYSLRWETLGQCLYTTSFEQNAVSVALSPISRHLVVGFASRRVSIVPTDRWIMARIYKIEQKDVPGDRLPVLRELDQHRENRINCIRWLPTSGQGLIYATNTGQLVILS